MAVDHHVALEQALAGAAAAAVDHQVALERAPAGAAAAAAAAVDHVAPAGALARTGRGQVQAGDHINAAAVITAGCHSAHSF